MGKSHNPRMRLTICLFSLTAVLFLAVPESRGATRTWSGFTTNTQVAAWSDTNNWVGNIRPAPGDDVIFPSTGQQRENYNDLVTNLHEIVFADGGYVVSGNSFTLTGGIIATNSGGINVFSDQFSSPANLNLGADLSITNLNASSALALLTVDLEGKSLVLGGAGTNSFFGLKDTAGGGRFTNDTTGTFLFFGTNVSFSGPMALEVGTNVFLGIQQRSPITWTAGTLGGTGTLGNVTASGPGAKLFAPGYLVAGTLTISNLVLDPAVTVAFQINGTNFQTDYSHVSIGIQGGISGAQLGLASLSVSFPTNFAPAPGTAFTLFLTDTHGTISGAFTNMPEGSTMTNNGTVYQLSYNLGRAVTLTVTEVLSTGVSRYWTGFGGDGLWSNPQNWQNNAVPQQGDNILFEQGHISASFIVSTNDLQAETTFDSIHFQILQASTRTMMTFGNSFRLNSGVFLEATPGNAQTGAGTCTISNHISLNNSQPCTNSITATLRLAGGVDLGANTLAVGALLANGPIFFDGSITGAGLLEMDGGNGTVVLTASNAITGSIDVNSGALVAQHPQALGSASAGPVHVAASGVLNLNPTNPAPFTGSSITLAGTLSSGAPSFDVSLAAPIVVSGSNAIITIPAASFRTLSLSGPITNNTQLTVSQHGGLGSANLPAGSVVQGGGILRVTNDSPSAGAGLNVDGVIHNTVLVNAGINVVTLSGAGQIDSLICTNCGLQPGSSYDSSLAYNPLSAGTLLMANGQNHFPDIIVNLFPNRPGGAPTNTAIIATNAPTLGSAQLVLLAKTNLTPNQQFTIIRNLSSAPVTNTFLNLPEGAVVLPFNGNLGARISYVGGAGHDVVLTVQSNQPPVFTTPTNTVFFNVLSNNVYTNAFSDFEQPSETFMWTNLTSLPTGLVLNPTTGVMSWTPAANQAPSTNIIVVKVTDSGTPPLSATGQVTIIVRPINQAPVPVQIQPNPTNVLAGHTLTIQLQANDPDNPPDPPIWGAFSLPAGASITTNGLFTYTPSQGISGSVPCTVYVYDVNPNAANPTSPTNFLSFTVQVLRNSIVINALDSGVGSLRWAITNTSADSTGGGIEFNIPGTGPFKIAPLTPLPPLGQNTYLDGYSQPGSLPNTNAIGTSARIMIELSGENMPSGFTEGLDAGNASGVTIRGLCINRFTDFAVSSAACFVLACTHSGNAVEGCFIGTDTTGTNARPNHAAFNFGCACSCRIGGPDPSQRNLISGNSSHAVAVGGFGANNNIVQNNLIGTDRTGTNALGNGGYGIIINGLSGSGFGTVADNVICANALYGINEGETSDVIVRNKIGVGADGVTPLGNGSDGIYLSGVGNIVGGTNAADANVIANNNGFGVELAGQANAVWGNSIFGNTGRGIRLDPPANTNQSAPVLTAATANSASGTLTSLSNETYRIELFYSPDFNPNNQPQAKTFLGATNVTTGSSSNANFSIRFNQTISSGFLTATATDPVGDTSAISDGLVVSVPTLNIALVSGQARVLWLTNFSAFTLQSNNIAQPTGWADVPGAPGITGSNFFRDFAPTGAPIRFFRLRSP
jgi:autotransporter-associated beta strand protein